MYLLLQSVAKEPICVIQDVQMAELKMLITSQANTQERGVALDERSGRRCSCFKEDYVPERHGGGHQKERHAICAAAKIWEGKKTGQN